MAYTFYDPANPSTTQVGSAFAASAKANIMSIRDAVIWGMWPGASGYSYSQSGGTAAEPTSITASLNTERVVADLTWTSGNITTLVSKYYATPTSGADTASTATISYSAGEVTAVSGMAIGPLVKLLPLLGKIKTLTSDYATHAAATTGVNAHSLGTIASQSSASVSIAGGSIVGTTIGTTTTIGAPINAAYVREGVFFYYTITAGSTAAIDLGAAGWHEFGISGCTSTAAGTVGSITVTADLASAGQKVAVVYVLVYNGTGVSQYLNWPAHFWLGAVQSELAASSSHIFVVTHRCDGSGNYFRLVNYLGKVV